MKQEKIKFMEKITEEHQKYIDVMETSSNIMDKIDSLMNELTFYESFIPSFFSKHNGEGDGIRLIYEKMEDRSTRSLMFETVDLNMALDKYNEYMEGMEEFITTILIKNDGTVTESSDDICKNVDIAREKDSLYIESIFGGINNEKRSEPYTEAVKGIEFLIDFIPVLSVFKEKCGNVKKICEASKVKDDLNNSISMLFLESVSNFCFSNMKEIISSYYDILESVTETGSSKKKNNEFKLF